MNYIFCYLIGTFIFAFLSGIKESYYDNLRVDTVGIFFFSLFWPVIVFANVLAYLYTSGQKIGSKLRV